MAEIGLLASIVQVADIGLRLSLRLYAFGETVASADRSISAISNDVSLTSSVLKELGDLLKSDTSRIYSDNAVKTADAAVRECSKAFTEMDEMLLKKVPQLKNGDSAKQSRASLILERLRWPVIKGKIELLRVNLDRMKSTLTLMLNVIIYAKQVSERYVGPSMRSARLVKPSDIATGKSHRPFCQIRGN